MKFGLLTYSDRNDKFNIGDYIQSLAAKQFLPSVDYYINREKLSDFELDNIKMILNGWFMHKPENFPPSASINPLFVSFHLNFQFANILLNDKNIEYLRNKAPIGCRDYYTLEILSSKGIGSYYSGCLTLTLGETYKREQVTDDIYFVDVLFNLPDSKMAFSSFRKFAKIVLNGSIFRLSEKKKILKSIFTNDILKNAIPIGHILKSKDFKTYEERFEYAESLLRRFASAKLVVTSRIHCALPCLAMGVPVVFINGSFDLKSDQCRLNGIDHLFNTIYISNEGIKANFQIPIDKIGENSIVPNKNDHIKLKTDLIQKCTDFVKS